MGQPRTQEHYGPAAQIQRRGLGYPQGAQYLRQDALTLDQFQHLVAGQQQANQIIRGIPQLESSPPARSGEAECDRFRKQLIDDHKRIEDDGNALAREFQRKP